MKKIKLSKLSKSITAKSQSRTEPDVVVAVVATYLLANKLQKVLAIPIRK